MSHWIVVSDTPQENHPAAARHLRTASGKKGLNWIENPAIQIGGLLISPDIWDEDFSFLLQRCRKLRPGTPIHLLIEEDETDPHHPALNAGIRMQLGLSEPVSSSHLDTFLQQRQRRDTSVPQREQLLHEGAFLGIPISDFEDCSDLLFDLHLKIAGEKYLRVLNAREEKPWEQLKKYTERGVTHVYVSREAHERSLIAIRMFRDSISSRGNQSSSAWSEIQAAHSVRELSRLVSQLSTLTDLDAIAWDKTSELLMSFRAALCVDGPVPRAEQARRWIRRSMFLEHALSTFTIAAIIGRPLQFTRDDSFLHLGMAALYHDIALVDFRGEVPAYGQPHSLQGNALHEYLEHPLRAANHLASSLQADEVVLQAVLFHHWRRDGSGLVIPGIAKATAVPRLAEIIGMAEECASFLQANPGLDAGHLVSQASSLLEPKFSAETLSGLRTALASTRA